jgi:hypothetical protein
VKDRVALQSASYFLHYQRHFLTEPRLVINDAEKQGLIRPYTGSRIFEGTVGSTGISIATIARARCVVLLIIFTCSQLAHLSMFLSQPIQRLRFKFVPPSDTFLANALNV